MRKKLLSVLLTLALLLSTFPAGVLAVEPDGGGEVTVPMEVDTSSLEELPDSEQLLIGYMAQQVLGSSGAATYENTRGETELANDPASLKLYQELKAKINAIADGTEHVTNNWTFTAKDLGIVEADTLAAYGITDLSSDKTTAENQVSSAVSKKCEEAGLYTSLVLDYLLMDCPYALFWYDKTGKSNMVNGKATAFSTSQSYSWDTTNLTVTFSFSFTVASEYRDTAEPTNAYKTTTDLSKVTTAANTAKTISEKYESSSDYEKLEGYKNEICALTSYNDAASKDSYTGGYGNPWQLIWVFDNDSTTEVVCEGYSKAFQYLCDLGGLECYTISGVMSGGTGDGGTANGGPHMWNIVTLEGKNYLVDVTNSDEGSAGSDGSLFMAGTNQMTGTFGSTAVTYTFSSRADGGTTSYTYDNDEDSNMYNLWGEDVLKLAEESYSPLPKHELNIQPANWTFTYGEDTSGIKVLVSCNGCTLAAQDLTYKFSPEGIISIGPDGAINVLKAGETTLTITAAGNTTHFTTTSEPITVKVAPKDINSVTVRVEPETAAYTGSAITPTKVTVTDGSVELEKDIDYKVDYKNNTDVGTATVTVDGLGNYTTGSAGPATGSFTITPADITEITTAAPTATIQANDEKNVDAATVKGAIELPEEVDVTFAAGTTKLPITWADAAETFDAKGATYTYVGTVIPGANFNTPAKTLTATLTVKKVSVDKVVIADKLLNKQVVTDATDINALNLPTQAVVTYDDNTSEVADITWAAETLDTLKAASLGEKLIDVTVDYPAWATVSADVKAQAKVTLTDKKVANVTFNIGGSDELSVSYSGSPIEVTSIATVDGTTVEVEASSWDIKYSTIDGTVLTGAPTNAGTYKVTASFENENYIGEGEASFTIAPASIPGINSITLSPDEFTYTGKACEPTVTVKDGDKTLVLDTDYTVTYSNNVEISDNDPTVTITGMGNYTGTVDVKFKIKKAETPPTPDTKSFTVDDIPDQTYTGEAIEPVVTVKDGSKTLVLDTDYTVAYDKNTNVGEASVTVTGIGEYVKASPVTKTFKIVEGTVNPPDPAAKTFTVDTLPSYPYTGEVIQPKPVVRDSETKAVLTMDTDYQLSYPDDLNVNVGKGELKVSGLGDYEGQTEVVEFQITAPANPVLGISVTGDEGDLLAAKLDGNKIVVTGLGNKDKVPTVTLNLMKGLTSETKDNGDIVIKSGDTEIATYTVDTTGVEDKDPDIQFEDTKKEEPKNEVTGDQATIDAADASIKDENTKVDGLTNATANSLNTAAKELKDNLTPDKIAEINTALEVPEGETFTVKVETSVEITAKELTETTFKLDVTPQFTITAVNEKNSAKEPVVLQEKAQLPNSYIATAVTVSVKLPATLVAKGANNWFARHFLSGGRTEIIPVTVDPVTMVATWWQSSFSEVELFQNDINVTVTFPGVGTTTGTAKNYTIANLGEELPTPEYDTNKYSSFDGWVIDGQTYKTVTEDFLTAAAAAVAAGKTPTPKFTEKTQPENPPIVPPSDTTPSGGSSSSGTSGTSSPALRPLSDRNGSSSQTDPGTTTQPTLFFTDVPATYWNEGRNAILWASENGFMNGTSATTFQPDGRITRQAMWMILARLSGANPANMTEARTWAVNNGISDGTNPNNNMSRQQMVTLLYRYAQFRGIELTGSAELTTFPDNGSVSAYAQAPLAWAVANSIVAGTSQGTLNPTGTATRAQFAVILQRFYNGVVNA